MDGKGWANIAICLIVFIVAGYGVHRAAVAPDVVALLNPGIEPSHAAEALRDTVILEKSEFEINRVTHKLQAVFDLVNHGRMPVHDVVISCDFLDREAGFRGRGQWVLYDTLSPEESGRFAPREERRYISHLVNPENIVCRIIDLEVVGNEVALHGGHGQGEH